MGAKISLTSYYKGDDEEGSLFQEHREWRTGENPQIGKTHAIPSELEA